MPRKAKSEVKEIEEKLKYLGLNLEEAKKQFENYEPLKFRVPKFYDEKQYRQYRYIPIKEIQILLTPANRLDDIQEKYKHSSPISEYLDSENEENIAKHTEFLKMLKEFKVEDVEMVGEEQAKLSKKIPFKVKFEGNYLWQIYYSEETEQYFMLVPTEDTDYSTFFYLLKKQLEKKRTGKIFVPIRNLSYEGTYLKKSEYEDIENYLWLFTKDWPLVYEVYDKKEQMSIHIVGETEIYEKVKSQYKVKLDNAVDANHFYKLLKAMFILQTELPHYFEFKTKIAKGGGLEFYHNDVEINYENISEWISKEYRNGIEKEEVIKELLKENKKKLEDLKLTAGMQEIEYLAKEKQISTFLECKKTFFGKFKYYFKYNKKNKKDKIKKINIKEKVPDEQIEKVEKKEYISIEKDKYTIEELMELYKDYEQNENELKNILMDVNALKLKNKNMAKKIENATSFIEEIDNHKRSIFEFWKYSNKDEVSALAEGEQEEVTIIKKVTKVFDYVEDLDKFGITMDKIERKVLTKSEKDSIYLTTTNLLPILNKIKNNEVLPKEIENNLKEMKKQAKEENALNEVEEFDIFGGLSQDNTKISKIANKNHRENARNQISILEINKNTKPIGYKLELETVVDNIKKALDKVTIVDNLPVYKILNNEKLSVNDLNVFNINPENEIYKNIRKKDTKYNLYKINLKKGINGISYTNSIFYENQNKTLPIGQNISTKVLVDLSNVELKIKGRTNFKITEFEDENDDFSKVNIKNINVLEYDIILKEKETEEESV
ncbi:MAG: hypothetical protein ACLS90_02255 [Clostridia bacterium]